MSYVAERTLVDTQQTTVEGHPALSVVILLACAVPLWQNAHLCTPHSSNSPTQATEDAAQGSRLAPGFLTHADVDSCTL